MSGDRRFLPFDEQDLNTPVFIGRVRSRVLEAFARLTGIEDYHGHSDRDDQRRGREVGQKQSVSSSFEEHDQNKSVFPGGVMVFLADGKTKHTWDKTRPEDTYVFVIVFELISADFMQTIKSAVEGRRSSLVDF
ncbi:unnamed protein product [Linum trigynum]|uniref:Uncharacterized protein n=1 Tax=Linum trigynum TaxID=586398 RepID=A0AAV2G5W0_9ROSI